MKHAAGPHRPKPHATAQALAARRAELVARSQELRSAIDAEVRSLDRSIGQRVEKARHWLVIAQRVTGIGALVLPLMLARRRRRHAPHRRRGVTHTLSLIGRLMRGAPLALTLARSLRQMLQQRREAAGRADPG